MVAASISHPGVRMALAVGTCGKLHAHADIWAVLIIVMLLSIASIGHRGREAPATFSASDVLRLTDHRTMDMAPRVWARRYESTSAAR